MLYSIRKSNISFSPLSCISLYFPPYQIFISFHRLPFCLQQGKNQVSICLLQHLVQCHRPQLVRLVIWPWYFPANPTQRQSHLQQWDSFTKTAQTEQNQSTHTHSHVLSVWGLANIFSSLFEVITRPLLLLLRSETCKFFITLEGRHFVPWGNHFKYADTLSGQAASNFSSAV